MRYAILTSLLAACGGSSPARPDAAGDAPAVVVGNLGGQPFTPRAAIWTTAQAAGFDFDKQSTVVMVTDYADACALQGSNTGVPGGRILIFVLAATSATGSSSPISALGPYAVSTGHPAVSSQLVEPYFEVDDAHCLGTTKQFGASGTVTVSSTADPQAATFDVTFAGGEHVTGSYRATACAALNPNRTPLGGCPR